MPDEAKSRPVPPTGSGGLPKGIFVLAGLVVVLFLLGSNPVLGVVSSVVGCLVLMLLWRHHEPPSLAFVCGYQWLQAFAPVVQAELDGLTVSAKFGGPHYALAIWYSLLGVLIFSAGAALAMKWLAPRSADFPFEELRRLSIGPLLAIWVPSFLITAYFPDVLLVGGLRQGLQPLTTLGTIGVELLIFQRAFGTGENRPLALVIFGLELAVGLTGFFSGFRTVFYLVMLATLSLACVRRGSWTWLAATLVPLVGLCLFWQTIKSEYRSYASGGEQVQVVAVSLADRATYVWQAAQATSWHSLGSASEELLDRMGYITFFALCIDNVPRQVRHAEGRLWREAWEHVFMPRIFFPNKKELNDSERTNEFSGMTVAGVTEGTSIGIGYVGESYVDFGVPLMFLPIFLFGVVVGAAYGLVVRMAPSRVLGVAAGTSLLFGCSLLLESSNAKMFGGVVAGTVVYVTLFGVAGKWIMAWLCHPAPVRQAAP